MSNRFKLHSKHFSKRGEKLSSTPIYGHAYLGTICATVPTPSSPDKAISAISVESPMHKWDRWHSTADQKC